MRYFQKCVEKALSLGYDRGEYLANPAFQKVHFFGAEVVLSRAGHLTPAKKSIKKRRKTHVKKKILAVFLSLCMAMSLLPVTALAAEGKEKFRLPQPAAITFCQRDTYYNYGR